MNNSRRINKVFGVVGVQLLVQRCKLCQLKHQTPRVAAKP